MAHTTQFTERGWFYLGGEGCALLVGGGSYVSLAPFDGSELTVVIETVGATSAQSITFSVGASIAELSCWTTVEGSVFQQQAPIRTSSKGTVTVTVPPNAVWTLSTTSGQTKGSALPVSPPHNFPLPYSDDFSSYEEDALAKYFSDMHGAFSVSTESEALENKILRQQAGPTRPLSTHGASATAYSTVIGDVEWSNYSVQVRWRSEGGNNDTDNEFVFIGSHGGLSMHPEATYNTPPYAKAGVVAQFWMSGKWSLSLGGSKTPLASGAGTWKSGEWHTALLEVSNGRVTITLDAQLLGSGTISGSPSGPAWLGCGIHYCSFDDFAVTPSTHRS